MAGANSITEDTYVNNPEQEKSCAHTSEQKADCATDHQCGHHSDAQERDKETKLRPT